MSRNNNSNSLSIDTSPEGLKSSQTSDTADSTTPDLEVCTNAFAVTPAAATVGLDRPSLNTPLSEISKYFDRQGKGYLDPLEKQMRRMDSQNLGHVPVHKVYDIMTTLQNEQKQSADLLRTLEQQQRQMINMKKGIIALCLFAVALALSNIGTSFAAARLAQEIQVSSSTGDLTDTSSGQRVGVTSKLVNFQIQPVSTADRRRHLSTLSEVSFCRDPTDDEVADGNFTTARPGVTNTTTGRSCEVVGTLSYSDMVLLHQQFCNGWPGQSGCAGGGVDRVRLECNGRISYIDDTYLDEHEPETDPWLNYTVFPALGQGYHGTMFAHPPNADVYTGPPCLQDFVVGMYCDPAQPDLPCLVFAAMPGDTEPCYGEFLRLCGDPEAFAESSI